MRELLSPLDDRYADKTAELLPYFSNVAQVNLKGQIELDYLTRLLDKIGKELTVTQARSIEGICETIDVDRIKELEKSTKHDIKAIELYLIERFKKNNLSDFIPYIHFGLTSQDVNSLCTSTMVRLFIDDVAKHTYGQLIEKLKTFADECDVVMPARTHGQVAVPTTLKKEIAVYVSRLTAQYEKLMTFEVKCKFGGAVGNLSAHHVAYPEIDWSSFADSFCADYRLVRHKLTTQVDDNDWLAEFFNLLTRINCILIDFCRDMWLYYSFGYFKKSVTRDEVGSSTMPQKINPIEFENAEGNLEFANAMLTFMASKLQVSRLQRDLTDTTVIRNIGVPLGHCLIAIKSISSGVSCITPNSTKISADLDSHPEMLAEAIQTILRREGLPDAYEAVKHLTRGENLTQSKIVELLEDLKVSGPVKLEILALTPAVYVTHV